MIDCIVCRIIPDVADLKIKREKICRQDSSFMKKVRPLCEMYLKRFRLSGDFVLSAALSEAIALGEKPPH